MQSIMKILSAISVLALTLLLAGCPRPIPPDQPTSPAPMPQPPKPHVLPKPPVANVHVFHWPPPQASSTYTVPLSTVGKQPDTLADADRILKNALDKAGYDEKQYYLLPDAQMPGFVLVTRIEAFNKDGSPKSSDRWPGSGLSLVKQDDFSVGNILKVLLHMEGGHYRVIAFIVSASPVEQDTGTRLSAQDAEKWLSSGYSSLPDSVGSAKFTNKQSFCTALVYEFAKKSNKGAANLSLPGTVSAKKQLVNTGIFGK